VLPGSTAFGRNFFPLATDAKTAKAVVMLIETGTH
jgi:hypothetical protein